MGSQRKLHIQIPASLSKLPVRKWLDRLLPTPGNVLFTLLVIGALFWSSSAGAFPFRALSAPAATSINTIAYQGRLADSSGNPLTGTYNMEFRLYTQASGGTPQWNEMWTGANSVHVSDGLFSVMLGSLSSIPQDIITGSSTLWLGITVNTDSEMQPRVQLGTVPYAVQAQTVPDGSITTAKIASDSVTPAKLALSWGSVCLATTTDVVLTGNDWTSAPIPNMSLSFVLDVPSRVLVWATPVQQYAPAAAGYPSGTRIDVAGGGSLAQTETDSPDLIPATMIKQVQLGAGAHTIYLVAYAVRGGNIVYTPDTCLQYVVLD